jgi:hypothetical protein
MDFNEALERNLRQREALSKSQVSRILSRKQITASIMECFDLIGGVPRLAIWANDPENYGEFLKLWIKALPKEEREEAARSFVYQSAVPQSPLNRQLEKDIEDVE